MLDHERCWQAVCERDAAQDGLFVFAVRSTGIYCRPSCPARRPRRDNVSFHHDAASAEAAGFRPCKRCSPQGQSPAQQLDALVAAACELLRGEVRLTLPQLAARIGLSPSHLARAFKARTGMTPNAWAAAERRRRLDDHLLQADSVLDAALAAGYSGTRALYEKPQAMSPGQRRQRGAGEHLRYAIAPCPLGQVLLATSDQGICALLFGDEPAALREELQQRFAAARLEEDEEGLRASLEQVLAQLEEPERAAHLPLDIRGTAFQQRVWQALQGIPRGETRSYAQLAGQLDSHPRAIARACASNAIGLLLPCHRVVASDGSLSGYRWGLARKRQLLEQEQS
ncbi:bifunctional DNA-binding transcriptional regulator/O6-methylguanine-DNA methyltransferase Ada [Pseudomonas berkeleyensis]|uniref:Bifunctional DNA-binding transcriptional regulator/O6-methylguanine-DNA methyltransferase Ada n=1 Tax=Pseudomonas berkeleyensis TaxID=2726956 RepID=A0A7G5DLF6_9PSED|nr:bifunctional DNA-binding transcriptional regulator/O6-methylguanine-DNA methyltransferase Ada [Pseudomonas berkeleyensis]QMV62581.1 bifunctional DNA-binding transcriptional regulator/O6-methylguanine-DNA methyltransferase Ada [Pseudomonas berkeleyensis]WSO38029.1 bifunctional DNA-binding transcriptional regulator/O6-methylguanine-DNA methyltransferase Ada [Pseudomonas berkeleyensis]